MMSRTLSREAADALTELGRLRNEIEALALGLDNDAFLLRPAEGRWSVGECISHLNATSRCYLNKLRPTVDEARQRNLVGEGPVNHGLLGTIMVWAMEPPPRRRVRAPSAFLPAQGMDKRQIMREFRTIRNELAEIIDGAGDLDWSRIKMGLPTLPAIKLRLGAIFAMLLAHERRHLWQMQQIIASAGATPHR